MTNERIAPATVELLQRIYESANSKLSKSQIDLDNEITCQRIGQLLSLKLIGETDLDVSSDESTLSITYTSYEITAHGIDLLQRLEQEAQEKADAERKEEEQRRLDERRYRKDARRSWWQWIATTIIGILSLFLGAFLSQHTHWLDWFTGLFQ